MFETIMLGRQGSVFTCTLNRPDRRNAMDDRMMEEIVAAIDTVEAESGRVLVFTGAGTAFCAGADLNWMARMKDFGLEENEADAARLAVLFRRIRTARPVTVAAVNGPAIGGAVGIVAACDIALAVRSAVFSFGEVRLGIVPAVIGPYIVERTGPSHARYYMLTGERFDGDRAREIGLVHKVVPDADALSRELDTIIGELKAGGQAAQGHIKALLDRIVPPVSADLEAYTIRLIAEARISDEGQEGIAAFFEKRRPGWSETEYD